MRRPISEAVSCVEGAVLLGGPVLTAQRLLAHLRRSVEGGSGGVWVKGCETEGQMKNTGPAEAFKYYNPNDRRGCKLT